MSRFQKTEQPRQNLITSDWDNPIWDKSMYQKHYQDFLTIQKEYRKITEKCDSAIMARWYWLEERGAVTLKEYLGTLTPHINPDNYKMYSNMFDKFSDWTAFEEVKLGVERPLLKNVVGEAMKKIGTRMKYYVGKIDFNEPLPQQDNFNNLVQEATNNF